MIKITTMPKLHESRINNYNNNNKTQYKRFLSTSFIFVSCLRTVFYFPSISPEKCPKYLSLAAFSVFFAFIISFLHKIQFFQVRIQHLYNFLVSQKLCVHFASYAKRMHYIYIKSQGLLSVRCVLRKYVNMLLPFLILAVCNVFLKHTFDVDTNFCPWVDFLSNLNHGLFLRGEEK